MKYISKYVHNCYSAAKFWSCDGRRFIFLFLNLSAFIIKGYLLVNQTQQILVLRLTDQISKIIFYMKNLVLRLSGKIPISKNNFISLRKSITVFSLLISCRIWSFGIRLSYQLPCVINSCSILVLRWQARIPICKIIGLLISEKVL